MSFTFNGFVNEILLHVQKIGEALAQDDLGLFYTYVWTELVAFGIFIIAALWWRRLLKYERHEAVIAGLDFSNPKEVQPVCEYTDGDGVPQRAVFAFSIPSFLTGHKTAIYVEKANPSIAHLASSGHMIALFGLAVIATGLVGGWYSYLAAEAFSVWITQSLKEIALTEFVLLCLFLLSLPLNMLMKRRWRKDAEKLGKAQLFPFEQLSEVEDRIGQFKRSMRLRRESALVFLIVGCLVFYTTSGMVIDYLFMERATARVAADVLPTELQPLYVVRERKMGKIRVEWTAPSGRTLTLETNYPIPYVPLRKYEAGDEIAILLDPENAALIPGYTVDHDPGAVVAALDSLISLLCAALLICLGRSMKLPKEWGLCKDGVVMLSQESLTANSAPR